MRSTPSRCATGTKRTKVVLFGMQNGTFGPCLAAIHRMLIPVMPDFRGPCLELWGHGFFGHLVDLLGSGCACPSARPPVRPSVCLSVRLAGWVLDPIVWSAVCVCLSVSVWLAVRVLDPTIWSVGFYLEVHGFDTLKWGCGSRCLETGWGRSRKLLRYVSVFSLSASCVVQASAYSQHIFASSLLHRFGPFERTKTESSLCFVSGPSRGFSERGAAWP
jgi:hypothetical protein